MNEDETVDETPERTGCDPPARANLPPIVVRSLSARDRLVGAGTGASADHWFSGYGANPISSIQIGKYFFACRAEREQVRQTGREIWHRPLFRRRSVTGGDVIEYAIGDLSRAWCTLSFSMYKSMNAA